jgi:hypothetical protein
MKVAAYLHPGIFPQGPLWNEVWIDTRGRMLQALHRDGFSPGCSRATWCLSACGQTERGWASTSDAGSRHRVPSRTRSPPSCQSPTSTACGAPGSTRRRSRSLRFSAHSLDETAAELAESRRLIAPIHASTSWQMTAPMRALATTYRAALGKARRVCRHGAATGDRASKPSFGKVTAYTAKQGGRRII